MARKYEKYLITQAGCGGCRSAKNIMRKKGLRDRIGVLPVEGHRGRTAAEEAGVKRTPECVEPDGDGGWQRCDINDALGLEGGDRFAEDDAG